MKINNLYLRIISLPKTIYFNFKYLPVRQAIKLPIFVSYNTFLGKTKGNIKINSCITTSMINIGFGEVGIFDRKRCRTMES